MKLTGHNGIAMGAFESLDWIWLNPISRWSVGEWGLPRDSERDVHPAQQFYIYKPIHKFYQVECLILDPSTFQ